MQPKRSKTVLLPVTSWSSKSFFYRFYMSLHYSYGSHDDLNLLYTYWSWVLLCVCVWFVITLYWGLRFIELRQPSPLGHPLMEPSDAVLPCLFISSLPASGYRPSLARGAVYHYLVQTCIDILL